jgi:hypothetical protein
MKYNRCVDIQNQNPYPGGTLIGFECLGQWNQYFHINTKGQVVAIQPAQTIGRTRGFLKDAVLCVGIQKFSINISSIKLSTKSCLDDESVQLTDTLFEQNYLN